MAHTALVAPSQYVRPTIVAGGGSIDLLAARHPVMEFQEAVSFISNDYRCRAAKQRERAPCSLLRCGAVCPAVAVRRAGVMQIVPPPVLP